MRWFLLIILLSNSYLFAQKTTIKGSVIESDSKEPIPFASVFFEDSKIGTITDENGAFFIETYYAAKRLIVRATEFEEKIVVIQIDKEQELIIELNLKLQTSEEIEIHAPKEKPSTILYRKILKNKPVNNREKLDAYDYESYNKIQIDLNNISDRLEESKLVKNLSLIKDYIDTVGGKKYLPIILSETISDYYVKRVPRMRKEVMKASRITGVDNLELEQFLGEMYQDINVYDNYIGIFDKSLISPISNVALGFYTLFLKDSAYIDNHWCYLMTFTPKRTGELTLEGEMWIHDTTYAVKEWSAMVSEGVNINYVQELFLHQSFDQVESGAWMLTLEKMLIDLNITRNSKTLGFYGKKLVSRKNFNINQPYPDSFYRTKNNVEKEPGYNTRTDEYWREHRHFPLDEEEKKIEIMIDSLNRKPLFKFFKGATFMAATGYYAVGPIEIGDIRGVISHNRVEGFRNQVALRTSNDFSRVIQLGGRVAYGYKDKKVKYGALIRWNITPKKRGMLDLFYDYDVTQLGLGDDVESINDAIGSLMRTKPLTQLSLVEKFGFKFEKDISKSFIVSVGSQWKGIQPLGDSKFREPIGSVGFKDIEKIKTFETSLKIRWAKKEEFISGAFDRISVGSRIPIFSIEGIYGIPGVLGSEYNYQKVELKVEHKPRLGLLGLLRYEVYGGMYFGLAPYPLLNIHEGAQTYWIRSFAHNKMDYYEFISDKYVGAMFEHHFNGLILGHVPGIKKLRWRFVLSGRATWGTISNKQKEIMMLPENTKPFGKTPYVEGALGIENIFNVFRVDLVWRMTHLEKGVSPLGIRAKFDFRF